MTKVRIYGYGEDEVFEILDREKLQEVINDISPAEVCRRTIEEVQKWNVSGTAYTYADARTGKFHTSWIQNGSQDHPFDNYYRIILCREKTGTDAIDLKDEEFLLSNDERRKYLETCESAEDYISPKEWLAQEYPDEKEFQKEIKERIEAALDWLSEDFQLDEEDIKEQIEQLYTGSLPEETV